MMQQDSLAPSAPRAARTPSRHNSARLSHRGGIQKQAGNTARVDRDGDLEMEATVRSGQGKGIRNITSKRGSALRDSSQHQKRDLSGSRRPERLRRGGIDPSTIQHAVLRGMNHGAAASKPSKSSVKETQERGRLSGKLRELEEHRWKTLKIWGLNDTKASSNRDGGVRGLINFLERKATSPNTHARDAVKIKKSHLEGDVVVISVRPEDVPKILRLSHFSFAGGELTIESSPQDKSAMVETSADFGTPSTIEVLRAVLNRRYNPETKLLDLSQIGKDPDLISIGMFNSTSRESKFFPALMKICDQTFKSQREKEEAIVSVSLADNALPDIASVTTLAPTLPTIRNLDLSNNNFQNLAALGGWRAKFRKLDRLILAGNPVEVADPNYKDEILRWYPTLTALNDVQVRSLDEVTLITKGNLPLPILGPRFCDEGEICQNFIKNFYPLYDLDRTAVVNSFYDDQSKFSLSVNPSAPRDPDSLAHKPAGWDQYIKKSRNLTKISQSSNRMSLLHTGAIDIRDVFVTLPATRHPDIEAELHKWCIECHALPGIPDPLGQSASGVGGLIVTVHGEFDEINVSTGQAATTRSFDRTFILGPAAEPGRIRIICDNLVLRAYGGHDAWKAEETAGTVVPPAPPLMSLLPPPTPVPDGLGPSNAAGPATNQAQQEALLREFSQATGMTLAYSQMCLESSGWDLQGAGSLFEQARASQNLPPEAFATA